MKSRQELPADGELSAARDVVTAFLVSLKNYDLYPSDHSLAQNFLKNIHSKLESFLSLYGEMRIDVEQKCLTYKSIPIYKSQSSEDNLAFLLYRDGVLWIEFTVGVTIEEIKTFFSIINKYKVLRDEPEDDIVTSLWHENLAHIDYDAKEIFFEDVPPLDFSKLNVKQLEAVSDKQKSGSADIGPVETDNVIDIVPEGRDYEWWDLSPEELELLGEMVREAEVGIDRDELLQLLFFVLTEQNNAEDFSVVLNFLKDEWFKDIEKGDFSRVVLQLQNLKNLKQSLADDHNWLMGPLALLFEEISGKSFLSSLKIAVTTHLNGEAPDTLMMFREFLLLLKPKALTLLGQLAPYIDDKKVLDTLLYAMVDLGNIDISPLAELLENENELIALQAMQVLSKIKAEKTGKLFAGGLQHSSAKVRRFALRAYLETASPSVDEVFKCIEDPDTTIRSIALSFLGRERNEQAEKLLLNYLRSRSQHSMDEADHIHNCYTALGRCGSGLSVPFLKKILLSKRWKSILSGGIAVHQLGAIKALSKLQVEEAKEVLKLGAASFFPAIRKSCLRALNDKTQG